MQSFVMSVGQSVKSVSRAPVRLSSCQSVSQSSRSLAHHAVLRHVSRSVSQVGLTLTSPSFVMSVGQSVKSISRSTCSRSSCQSVSQSSRSLAHQSVFRHVSQVGLSLSLSTVESFSQSGNSGYRSVIQASHSGRQADSPTATQSVIHSVNQPGPRVCVLFVAARVRSRR